MDLEYELTGKLRQEPFLYDNIVTVLQSFYGQPLTKTIYANGHMDSFSNVKYYNFHKREVFDFDELTSLLRKVIAHQGYCLVRSVPKDDAKVRRVQRIARADSTSGEPTLIEWPQNWYALDIDNYSYRLDSIELSAQRVLLALPPVFRDARCLALATSSYGIKRGICLRMLFWNSEQITSDDLKQYFVNCKFIDRGFFNPAQPIYVAKPVFVGCSDPIADRLVEVNPQGITTDIKHYSSNYDGMPEVRCTKQQAESYLPGIFERIAKAEYQGPGKEGRHWTLIREAKFMGKLVGQEHFDRDIAFEWLWSACETWDGPRNKKKDAQTINDGLDSGIGIMEF